MALSKKYYILIADAINRSRPVSDQPHQPHVGDITRHEALDTASLNLAGCFAEDNEEFNVRLFLKACGAPTYLV